MDARNNNAMVDRANWPVDVDLNAWYNAERNDVDEYIHNASDMSVWTLDSKRENLKAYVHCKNNEKLSYSMRAVVLVSGSVGSVMECLRSPESAAFRNFQKLFHGKTFVDGEVLHTHSRSKNESMAIKWMVYASPKPLGKSKEFCIREYCSIIPNHPKYGLVGICRFESYDGAGAQYGIRAKNDTYGLTVFEPSAYVVQQNPEEGMVTVTLTFSMRKARGSESVSSGVKLIAARLALEMTSLQRAVQHTLFQPGTLVQKKEWVTDSSRTNCSLCVQTFGMLKRRHHCRVCGEVVCSSCTVFKLVNGEQDLSKIRVCKACLAKSVSFSTDNGSSTTSTHSICSTASIVSDDNNEEPVAPSMGMQTPPPASTVMLPPQFSLMQSSPYTKGSALSMDDFEKSMITTAPSISSSATTTVPTIPRTMSASSNNDIYDDIFDNNNTNDIPSSASREKPPVMQGRKQSFPGGIEATGSSGRFSSRNERRIHYFNEDFEEICMLAMETLQCPMAGIRNEDFELVKYYDSRPSSSLPRSLPTFRRIASRGKPCIVLDVSEDKRISGEKRYNAKLQFFIGIPLMIDGEVIGDLCVADRYPRENIDYQQVEVLTVLGETVTQYMQSQEYMDDLTAFKESRRKNSIRGNNAMDEALFVSNQHPSGNAAMKEVAF